MISAYSICSAVIFYNLSLVLVFLLRRKTRFLARYSTSVLLFITVLGLVRLFTPIDLKPAVVIPSTTILPAVQSALLFNIPVLNISIGLVLLTSGAAGLLDSSCGISSLNYALIALEENIRSWRTSG